MDPSELASGLGALGYSGFAHHGKARALRNPAELVARTISHADLECRLVEALPWVLVSYADLDWSWLVAQVRLLNLQNRLGYLVDLALLLPNAASARPWLLQALAELNSSRLVEEGTLCRDSMPEAERRWMRAHRPPAATHWNLLTTLTAEQLTHAD